METIMAGCLQTPEGHAAFQRAIEEAELRDGRLIVVHYWRGGHPAEAGVAVEQMEEFERLERQLTRRRVDYLLRDLVRGKSPAEDLVEIVDEEAPSLIVFGLRCRSPVGKVGSGQQLPQCSP